MSKQLEDAEHDAKEKWWRKLINKKRKPEGTFDGLTGLFTPSEREAPKGANGPDLTPRVPRYFQSTSHVWRLVNRAAKGEPVPPDIEASFHADYGGIHERVMVEAVDKNIKRVQLAEWKASQRAAKKAATAEANTHTARIAHKERLIKNLERKIKTLQSHVKRHKRSIAALKRAEAKKAT